MAADGWEFGLHPAIHVKDAASGFEAARAWLESRLGHSVAGLRHHYWALDWRDPTATHRRHQRAGFRYDSSIAWRDRAGFRAGTALPYHPFDPVAGRALDLLEIPCVLMDGHVLEADIGGTRTDLSTAVGAGREVADVVAAVGGMLVTNWHQEVAFNRGHTRGYMAALGRLLEPLQGSPDVWVATPHEVCAHWTRRAEGLLRDAR
jgi:peptidoglycan/xylan/chitin deacetylase (PgdA/CDA1 family)